MVYLYLVKVSGLWILLFSLKRGSKFFLVLNHMAAIESEVYWKKEMYSDRAEHKGSKYIFI